MTEYSTVPDVIVVGAGPVGLTASALLRRAGLSVRLLERRREAAGDSRAMTIHPRTLEILDALPANATAGAKEPSISDRMVALGLPIPAAHFAVLPQMVRYDSLDTKFPFVLMLPQPITERLLQEYLTAAGVEVETCSEVSGLEQDDNGVTLTVAGREPVRASYVVGADGARSTVRSALGVGASGTLATQVDFIADVRLDRPPVQTHHWDPDVGAHSVIRLPSGVHGVFGHEARDIGITSERVRERQAAPLDYHEPRAILHRVAKDDYGLREVLWTARTSDATRVVGSYRIGRAFLAGDAAHVHPPAGGQGMNVDIQDAANLAWKLAAEVAGHAPERVISGSASFDAERRPAAQRLTANTLTQSALRPAQFALVSLSPAPLPELADTCMNRVTILRSARGWEGSLKVLVRPDGYAAAVLRSEHSDAGGAPADAIAA